MKWVWVLLLVVGCSTQYTVEAPPETRPTAIKEASVSVVMYGGDYWWICRGTYVLRGFAVLTAKHCLKDSDKVVVETSFGEERHPKDVVVSETSDVALLLMTSPSFEWVEVKPTRKKLGGFVTFWTGTEWSDGMILATTSGTTSGARLTATTAFCVKGNSGSLVVDSEGNVVGVVSVIIDWWHSAGIVPVDEVLALLGNFGS